MDEEQILKDDVDEIARLVQTCKLLRLNFIFFTMYKPISVNNLCDLRVTVRNTLLSQSPRAPHSSMTLQPVELPRGRADPPHAVPVVTTASTQSSAAVPQSARRRGHPLRPPPPLLSLSSSLHLGSRRPAAGGMPSQSRPPSNVRLSGPETGDPEVGRSALR